MEVLRRAAGGLLRAQPVGGGRLGGGKPLHLQS